MIFTRIRVGELSHLEPWEKIHVSPPCFNFPIFLCFTQPPPLRTTAVSWGSYGWEWSVAGLSELAHMHTPPTIDFTMAKETTAITPVDILLSPRWCWNSHVLPIHDSPFSVHPHTWTIVCSLFSRTGIFPGFDSHSKLGIVLFHPRFPVKDHSHFRLYDLLTDWYGHEIYCHFNVEIGTIVLLVNYGHLYSPQDLLRFLWSSLYFGDGSLFISRIGWEIVFILQRGLGKSPWWLRFPRMGCFFPMLWAMLTDTFRDC